MRALAALPVLVGLLGAPLDSAAAPGPSSCESCHGNPDWFAEGDRGHVGESFQADVHASVGLSCHDCHGGNPDPALAEDFAGAMDPEYAANPYRGVPPRRDIPGFCGDCHSDSVYMGRFRPDSRVDQEQEYATSHHGIALARGDDKVATCVDCHGRHDILRAKDSQSPVHPTRVAETCRSCHADAARMVGYQTDDGSPLPVDQYASWRRSVHAIALLEGGDLSAPTCNDCHGNHGARPPGLDSLAFVCGRCHGREASLFRASPKRIGFERHNELYLAEGRGGECGECHMDPEPQAALKGQRHFTECATCHGNHAVLRPTIAMLSPLPAIPCALCHESPRPVGPEAEEVASIRANYERTRDALLDEAGAREGQALFDWMMERVYTLPFHHQAEASAAGARAELLPAVSRLVERFRIGKIGDPPGEAGNPASGAKVRCSDCHAESPLLAGPGHPYETGREFVDRMRELTVLAARADRTLLRARRGGVEVRAALTHLDQALASEIELQALVHGFDASADSAFVQKQTEGVEHALAALTAGHDAIGELETRRQLLAVALVLIVLVLIALGLKIRRLG